MAPFVGSVSLTLTYWEGDLQPMRIFGCFSQNNNKEKRLLRYFKAARGVVLCTGRGRGPQWQSELVACVLHILPIIVVLCWSVMCFLTCGWAWMECWRFKDGSLSPSLSLWSQQDYELKLFHLMQQGRSYMRAVVCYHCCLNGLCVQFIILLDTQVLFMRLWLYVFYIHNEIC